MKIDVTEEELALLIRALDSHKYWQLSDRKYRNDGFVLEPGSDDEEAAEEIQQVTALEEKLELVAAQIQKKPGQ